MGAIAAGDLVDGKYRIIRTIGEGGWGVVFEGENIRTFKRVAIKVLRPHSGLTKDIIQRFEREAQAAGRIGSEHIVEVYDLGSLDDGTHYMVMELLTGEELSSRLKVGPMEGVSVARFTLQLLDGLKAAHEAGILHRDLKPENLFLVPTRTGEEFVKILDFGISKFNANGPQHNATMTGAVLGSPCYMAPEQARGLKQVDPRTDLYAVGTLMFESLTGRVPFTGDNFNDLMFKIVLAPRPDPREIRPEVDPTLALIVVKAMAIDPKDRYQNAEAFSAALTDWLATQGVSSVRPPELKRVMSGTPRTSREMRLTPDGRASRNPSQREQKATVLERGATPGAPGSHPQWDATMPAEGLGTPLVASSASGVPTTKPESASRKRLVAIGAAGAAVVILGAVALLSRGPSTPPKSSGISADPPQTPPAASSVVEIAPPPPQPAVSTAVVDPDPSASSDVAPTSSNAPARPTGTVAGARPTAQPPTRPTATAAAPPAPATTQAPAPTAPTATAAATAKPVSTVEGREIRTGL
ncbi:MAG TPA: protein kinase [Polyangiaceae bacterium]